VDKILLTILSPTLNCKTTINEMLESVKLLEQSWPGQIQHLIGDGGSVDGTEKILDIYNENHNWVKLFKLPNQNIPETLNSLISYIEGQWFIVMNGDDYFNVKELLKCKTILVKNEKNTIYYSNVDIISKSGKHLGYQATNLKTIHNKMELNHQGMICSVNLLNNIKFNPNFHPIYDYVWIWTCYISKNVSFKYLKYHISSFRLGGLSDNNYFYTYFKFMFYKINKGYIFLAIYSYLKLILKSLLKFLMPKKLLIKIKNIKKNYFGTLCLFDMK